MQRWDIFCRVIDNFGDVGVCWRLARQLAEEHQAVVRLWVDNLESFAPLCPSISTSVPIQQFDSVEVRRWPTDFPETDVADVVIEAFACEIPESYIAAMARCSVPPCWINLEYLSAEAWVEDCHLLTSPHPRWPLKKTFFFPGFTSRTGGLLRERSLISRRDAFDAEAASRFLSRLNVAPRVTGELIVSMFCYENAALPELLSCWAEGRSPLRVLSTPGAATDQIAAWCGASLAPGITITRGPLTIQPIPFLAQPDYDLLLWSCDINFVRGEDSFVRAQWAARPLVWQIYPQSEGAHLAKLNAFLDRYTFGSESAGLVKPFVLAWNGVGDVTSSWSSYLASLNSQQHWAKDWAKQLDQAGDLANNLARFVLGI